MRRVHFGRSRLWNLFSWRTGGGKTRHLGIYIGGHNRYILCGDIRPTRRIPADELKNYTECARCRKVLEGFIYEVNLENRGGE